MDTWKVLRAFIHAEDFSSVCDVLCTNLLLEDPIALLPILRGLLTEVLKVEDETIKEKREAKAKAKKLSAFQQHAAERGVADKLVKEEPLDEQAGFRRWKRTIRHMFNAEAACCMLDEALVGYYDEAFVVAANTLDKSWGPYHTYEEQTKEIDQLCLSTVMAPIADRYGFTPDLRGQLEISYVINCLAQTNRKVAQKQASVQKQVLSCFQNFFEMTASEKPSQIRLGDANDDEYEEEIVSAEPKDARAILYDLDYGPARKPSVIAQAKVGFQRAAWQDDGYNNLPTLEELAGEMPKPAPAQVRPMPKIRAGRNQPSAATRRLRESFPGDSD